MKILFINILLLFFLISNSNSQVTREIREGVVYINNPTDGLWQNRKAAPIEFELEMKFGAEDNPEEEILSSIRYICTDVNNSIYVFDAIDNRLLSFNSEGKHNWTKGRKGKGPGEFSGVRGMTFDGAEFIYFSNIQGSRIDQFNLSGDYIRSFSMVSLDIRGGFLMGFLKPGSLVIGKFKPGKMGADLFLVEVQKPLEIKAEIHFEDNDGMKISNITGVGFHVRVRENDIAIGHSHLYKIRYYDRNGKFKKVITRDFDRLVRPVFSERGVHLFGSLHAPFKFPKNNYEICFASFPTNVGNPERYVQLDKLTKAPKRKNAITLDFFNDNGELLYSFFEKDTFQPKIGRLLYIDHNDKLYTAVYEPYPQVRRYNVLIKQ